MKKRMSEFREYWAANWHHVGLTVFQALCLIGALTLNRVYNVPAWGLAIGSLIVSIIAMFAWAGIDDEMEREGRKRV